MYSSTFVLVLVSLLTIAIDAFRLQSVAIRGVVRCGSQPLADAQIKLFDEDDGPDPDDLMASGYTNPDGSFFLSGHERELTNIDPVFKLYHKCNDEVLPCERKWRITIPDKYITHGSRTPKMVFDLGNVNAEVELDGETRDCIH